RVSTNFLSSGSSITGFYWSIDNGANWNNVSYSENSANSIWTIDNGASDILLPVAAENQASLKLKWVANIVNATNGTYRIDDLNVTGIPDTTSNVPPVVIITSPANNTNYATPPATITIDATASDADGTITKVEFYNGSTLLGEDLTSPYSYTWTGVTAGNYQLKAKAIDDSSASTYSAIVNVTVGTSGISENLFSENQLLNFNYTVNGSSLDISVNNSFHSDLKVQLFNVLGQTMFSGTTKSNSFSLNTAALENGIYFLKVSSSTQSSVKKLSLTK
ncbi:MAG: Ig-like domain-containing protein, partial [Bacteroidota bacterium]